MAEAIRILLAGDHPVIRLGLANELGGEPDLEIIGQAKNRLEALEKAAELSPDVIIMDVTTPGLDWPGAIASIKVCLPRVRVLVFTMSEGEKELLEAMKAGAWGCLPNNFTASQAAEMLRSTADR